MKLERFKEKRKINKVIIIVFLLLLITGGFILGTTYSKYTYETDKIPFINGKVKYTAGGNGDITLAFYQDGEEVGTMPTKDSPYYFNAVDSNCTNDAKIEFDSNRWAPTIINLTKNKTVCSLYFNKNYTEKICSINSNSAACTLAKKFETDKVSLEYDDTDDHNLRYVGNNVNNYVTFNNEKAGWRIIGVFNNVKNQTEEDTNPRLKLIKTNSIGQYYIYNSDINTKDTYYWDSTDLYKTIKSAAYATNSLTETVDWWWGIVADEGVLAKNAYVSERSGSWSSHSKIQVGLIYPSDYGYSTGLACANTSKLGDGTYDDEPADCKVNSWLNATNSYWTIAAPYKGHNYYVLGTDIWNNKKGCIENYKVGYPATSAQFENNTRKFDVRPSVYLKSNVRITGGDGTQSNPYTLAL